MTGDEQSAFLFLFLGIFALITIGGVFFAFVFFLRKRGGLVRALNLQLLVVRLMPHAPTDQQNVGQIREKIALMEQFYSHLFAMREKWWTALAYGKPVFTLELTVPQVGEELSFYIAVSRRFVPAVEKVMQGIFPEAHIEVSQDYNIFNPGGVAAATAVVLRSGPYFPIKTYQRLEGDPLKAVTNVFTKLGKDGEGAALQIIATPAPHHWAAKLRAQARRIQEGKQVRKTQAAAFSGAIADFIRPATPSPTAPQTAGASPPRPPEPQRRITPLEEEMLKALEQKASKPLFETNIRLIASAATASRAREIVQGLEVAFAQFTDQNLNSFTARELTGSALKRFLYHFSFRIFEPARRAVLSADELTSVFHFPNATIETPHMSVLRAREAPPPPNLPHEGLILGASVFRGEERQVYFLDEDRRRHLYIIGQTGTGKSTMLENMAVQDIHNGKGVCFIDPHGEAVEHLLASVPRHRAQDVVYFNPGDVARPMGLNMLEYDPLFPEQKTFVVNELLSIFRKLFGATPESMGPAFEQYFRNSALLVMEHPASGNTILDISRVLSDKVFRDYKLAHCLNPIVRQFWQNAERTSGEQSLANFVPYVTNKFDNFTANEILRPIVAQERSAFNFREVMDSQKILLVNLSKGRLGDLNSSLIGLVIVGKLLMSALSRVDMQEERRKDFYLYIDEFQNVTTDSIATILSEARKYRLNLTITHQFIGQLKEEIKKAVFGNVGSMASFRIGTEDAEFMAKQYKPVFAEQDLLNIANRTCYLRMLINGQVAQPFNMKTYAPYQGDAQMAEVVKEMSRLKYGRSRVEVEQEILERHNRILQ